ncbi:hypothetical protein WJX82_007943 [Trebouxia sp. C0006]
MDLLQALVTGALAGVVVLILYWSIPGGKDGRAPLPPRGYGLPFIGDTFAAIAKGPRGAGLPHHNRLGSIYRTWFVGEQLIHVGDLDSVRYIMNAEHDLVEGHFPYAIRKILGPRGISTLHGKAHTQLRKILVPALSPKVSTKYVPHTVELAESACAEWAKANKMKGEDGMKAFTFQVATELILGFPKNFINKEILSRQQHLWTECLDGFLCVPINLPGFAFHKAMLAREAILADYHDNILRLIANADKSAEGLQSPLESYIQASKTLEDCPTDMEHYMNVAFNLLFAGHDTSASALTLLLRYLKQEPEVLEKLREEQRQVTQQHGKEYNATSLGAMPYADATIKEALRFIAIVTAVGRKAIKSFEVGGYTIPKGYNIQLELWKVLEDDPRWAEGASPEMLPSKFNPNRWLSEEGRRQGSWIPFGSGPRMCVGYVFALQEMKIMLAVLARGYDWQVDLTEPIKNFPLSLPSWGLPMTFHKLDSPTISREE